MTERKLANESLQRSDERSREILRARANRMARCLSRPADRSCDCACAPRPCAQLDGGITRDGGWDVALGEIASRLAYESEAAFSRAFKRFVGISPGAARRREPRALHNAAALPKR